jgi:hypothetical protein
MTRGTPWQSLDVFLAENLKDRRLAHGNRWVHTSAVPFHMARCVGLASRIGFRTRGIDRTEFLVLHDQQDLVEDCRFVWNGKGYDLGYSPGMTRLRNTSFIGSDPNRGAVDSYGIGGSNHVAGFLSLENVTIDGYRVGFSVPPRGVHTINGGFINGIRKIDVPCPWGGRFVVKGVKFGTMKGEEPLPILFDQSYDDRLYAVSPFTNWTRKLQPFEFIYNDRQVYHADQKADAVPFKRWAHHNYGAWNHGPLDGKTSQQLWERYRLAIGGRLAPAGLNPCPDVRGGFYGPDAPFDPAVEQETNTAYYGGKKYVQIFGPAKPDDVKLHPRYMYDPLPVQTPQRGYVANVRVGDQEYQSEPTDLEKGVNVVPIRVGSLTRHVVVGHLPLLPPADKEKAGTDGQ